MHGTFAPAAASTLGASFVSTRALDPESNTTVRLQLWDTAGQERFRALSALYYRGCAAVLLVYSICDARSFAAVGGWLREVRATMPADVIVHVVGTKADVVAADPGRREVPFERCIAYVAEHLLPGGNGAVGDRAGSPPASASGGRRATVDKRGSGLWALDVGWDVCHEVSASSGEGIEEVFRVITRKLVDQAQGRAGGGANRSAPGSRGNATQTPGVGERSTGYFDRLHGEGSGTVRLGGDKRRSWLLGFPTPSIGDDVLAEGVGAPGEGPKSKCC